MNYAKKSLGQNFLKDKNIIKKITNLLNLENKNIIEIGPGNGALTDEIIKKNPRSIKVIEKDYDLFKTLKNKYNKLKNFKIYNNDILKFDINKIIENKTIILGNLPYNISSQIFIKTLKISKLRFNLEAVIYMFQKELGEKIISKFPSPNYGRLSILFNLKFDLRKKFLVSSNCFFPKPKVKSLVIYFTPKSEDFYKIKSIENLEKITNILFSNKRKMINKNINKILNKKEIDILGNLNLKLRPADIEPQIYYKITKLIEK